MRVILAATFLTLAVAAQAPAANPKDCLDLSAAQDQDVNSPSGIRVTIVGRNHCGESVDGSSVRFNVKVFDRNRAVIGSQEGRFETRVAPAGRAETKVFVVCDPYKVGSLTVE